MQPGKSTRIRPAVYGRYILLNLPELGVVIVLLVAVRRWLTIPEWLFWSLIAVWIVKDVVMFPFVWRAYDQKGSGAADAMRGEQGIVRERLDPAGYVQVRGERWKAEREGGGPPLEAGSRVRIHRREGLTLFVEPDDGG